MATSANRGLVPLAVLSAGAFATVVNATLLSPLLRPIATEFGVSEAVAGQVGTPAALVAVLVALAAAPWMDRIPRRTWLRAQSVGLAVATVVSAFAPSFGWLVAGRVLAGLGGAIIMANCFTAAGEIYADPARRDRAIGIIASAATVAIVAGLPALAQIEAAADWRWALASLLVPLVLLFAGTWWLPAETVAPRAAPRHSPVAAWRRVLGNRETVGLLGTMAVLILVYIGWLTYFGAYAATDFGAGASTLSALFLVAGAAELVANALTPALLRRFVPHRLVVAVTLIFAINLLLTGVAPTHLGTLFVATAITSVCSAILYIVVNSRLLDTLPEARGAVMSLSSASAGVGAASGAMIGGAALTAFGDYAGVYRVLGLIALLAIVCLALSAHKTVVATVPHPTAATAVP